MSYNELFADFPQMEAQPAVFFVVTTGQDYAGGLHSIILAYPAPPSLWSRLTKSMRQLVQVRIKLTPCPLLPAASPALLDEPFVCVQGLAVDLAARSSYWWRSPGTTQLHIA